MSIFITGATGYVGSALTRRLLSEGKTVKALCRPASRSLLPRHAGVEAVEAELTDTDRLAKAMEHCEQVYHLAAYARVWSPDRSVYREVNVTGTRSVMEAARKVGVKKVVFTSTAGVLGPETQVGIPVTEDTVRIHPFFNDYEQTKWEAEQLCRSYATDGLPVVIVNPSRIYGPGPSTASNAVTRLISLFLDRKWRFIPGDGNGIGNYVFIDDVVNGQIAAMEKGKPGERYILGGENRSYKDFFFLMRDLCRSQQKLYHLPLGAMLAFSKLEEFKARGFNVDPMITPQWVKKYLYNWPLSSAKAEREIGYSITPLQTGLETTIAFIKARRT